MVSSSTSFAAVPGYAVSTICLPYNLSTPNQGSPYDLSSVRFVQGKSVRTICLRTVCPKSVRFVFRTICLQTGLDQILNLKAVSSSTYYGNAQIETNDMHVHQILSTLQWLQPPVT